MPSTLATREFAASHPAFAGHFPGAPLLPGVLLLAAVMEEAGLHAEPAARFAAGSTLLHVKFLAPVLPGSRVDVVLDWDDKGLRFELRLPTGTAAKGAWSWMTKPATATATVTGATLPPAPASA